MTYTAVFQNSKGEYSFTSEIETPDRNKAWKKIHDERADPDTCLVLLIDGEHAVRTYNDILKIS